MSQFEQNGKVSRETKYHYYYDNYDHFDTIANIHIFTSCYYYLQIGLADIWVLCGLEFCKLACPEFETLTPWTKQHLERVRNHPKVKNHLESRPDVMV